MAVSYRDYIHPDDEAAFEQLKSIPAFPAAVKAFMKVLPERVIHGMSMAGKIRLGPDQLPKLYGLLPPICEELGIEEPEFYLQMSPIPNAMTQGGGGRAFITVNSGLVESLEEDELRAVLAHECGHIACQHVVYHTMAQMLLQFGSSVFGPLATLAKPLEYALLYWNRRGELSSDRAAAVVMKGPQSVVDVLVRLAGGPLAITADVDIQRYVKQAEAYDKLQESEWNKVLMAFQALGQTHPFHAVRTREILKWCEGPEFQGVLDRAAQQGRVPKCPSCQTVLRSVWRFCGKCGAPVSARKGRSRGQAVVSS